MRGNALRIWTDGRGGKGEEGEDEMCPWSDVVPEDVEAPLPRVAPGALCESLCALFELSQTLCFSATYTGPDSCVPTAFTCPLLAFFFSIRRPLVLLSSLSFCPLRFPASSPCPATFRGHVNRVFFSSFSPLSVLRSANDIRSPSRRFVLARLPTFLSARRHAYRSAISTYPVSRICGRSRAIIQNAIGVRGC